MRKSVIRIYHIVRPVSSPSYDMERYKKKGKTMSSLIGRYLCDGAESACVKERACECLPACRYGQEYLRRTKDGESARCERKD